MVKLRMALLVLVWAGCLHAAVRTVDDDGPADFATIQAAIDAAEDGDVIQVWPGNYPQITYFNSRAVTVMGADPNGIDQTVVAGEVVFDFFEGQDSVLMGLTLTGGVRCLGASPSISQNIFRDTVNSRAITGSYGAAPAIVGNIFQNNTLGAVVGCHGPIRSNRFTENGSLVLLSGGAIYQCNGSIRDNDFQRNRASRGAALGECHGTIAGNTIVDNTAQQYGGGLHDCDGSIMDNRIENNACVGATNHLYGGGLSRCDGSIRGNAIVNNRLMAQTGFQARGGGLYECNAQIVANRIAGNIASGQQALGGGISQSVTGRIEGNLISANRAVSGESVARGGGLYLCDAVVVNNIIDGNLVAGTVGAVRPAGGGLYQCATLTNNTIVGNRSVNTAAPENDIAGGIYLGVTVRNNIVAYNDAAEGGGLWGEGIQNSYNLFWGNTIRNFGGLSYGKMGDQYANPLFAANGFWDTVGTPANPLDDIWNAGDYHPQSTVGRWNGTGWVADGMDSPAIDGGHPGDPAGLEPNPNGGRVNLGAYGGTAQASLSPWGDGDEPDPVCTAPLTGDSNGDCRVDMLDLALIMSQWLACNLEPASACQ